jgi:dolichol-phosphate mannosyltransferase
VDVTEQWSKCSVIVACFNEEKNIVECIQGINKHVPGAEILVIVGGTDNTAKYARNLIKDIPTLKVIENRPDYGKGHATKEAILAAKNDLQAEIDGDLQFDSKDLPSILQPLINGQYKVVNGSRHIKYDNWKPEAKDFARDYGNKYLAFLVSILFRSKITDVTSGLHAWDRNFVKTIWFDDDKFSYPIELLMRTIGTKEKILDVAVSYGERKAGQSMHTSFIKVVRAGLKMTCVILKTWIEIYIKKNIRAKSYPSTHSTNNH